MERTASLVLGLVESVILLRRRSPESIDAETAPAIADAALRVIGLDDAAVRRIRVAGAGASRRTPDRGLTVYAS